MKYRLTLTFTLGFFAALLASCEKEETKPAQLVNTNNVKGFACKIDGSDFVADSGRVNFYAGGMTVIAYKGGASAFEINTITPLVAQKPFSGRTLLTYISGNNLFGSISGTLNIELADSVSASSKGTFNAIIQNNQDSSVLTISDGAFIL
ncbi:MAG: hypothetical protein MUE96_05760 [Bacteroidia bacterium]|jgi:hypothetical protein|nr:hypothetical protein [Bacteroidia bacterium]